MPETGVELTDFEFSGCDLVHHESKPCQPLGCNCKELAGEN